MPDQPITLLDGKHIQLSLPTRNRQRRLAEFLRANDAEIMLPAFPLVVACSMSHLVPLIQRKQILPLRTPANKTRRIDKVVPKTQPLRTPIIAFPRPKHHRAVRIDGEDVQPVRRPRHHRGTVQVGAVQSFPLGPAIVCIAWAEVPGSVPEGFVAADYDDVEALGGPGCYGWVCDGDAADGFPVLFPG